MLGIFYVFKSFDYNVIFTLTPFMFNYIDFYVPFLDVKVDILSYICFFLFVGAVGKSAQVGLHT
jgi:NADH:ubiquinone oxidoreductase subunit 5 (subunit L)/multisubunit Na+/H+ antiporter MnhA subunit